MVATMSMTTDSRPFHPSGRAFWQKYFGGVAKEVSISHFIECIVTEYGQHIAQLHRYDVQSRIETALKTDPQARVVHFSSFLDFIGSIGVLNALLRVIETLSSPENRISISTHVNTKDTQSYSLSSISAAAAVYERSTSPAASYRFNDDSIQESVLERRARANSLSPRAPYRSDMNRSANSLPSSPTNRPSSALTEVVHSAVQNLTRGVQSIRDRKRNSPGTQTNLSPNRFYGEPPRASDVEQVDIVEQYSNQSGLSVYSFSPPRVGSDAAIPLDKKQQPMKNQTSSYNSHNNGRGFGSSTNSQVDSRIADDLPISIHDLPSEPAHDPSILMGEVEEDSPESTQHELNSSMVQSDQFPHMLPAHPVPVQPSAQVVPADLHLEEIRLRNEQALDYKQQLLKQINFIQKEISHERKGNHVRFGQSSSDQSDTSANQYLSVAAMAKAVATADGPLFTATVSPSPIVSNQSSPNHSPKNTRISPDRNASASRLTIESAVESVPPRYTSPTESSRKKHKLYLEQPADDSLRSSTDVSDMKMFIDHLRRPDSEIKSAVKKPHTKKQQQNNITEREQTLESADKSIQQELVLLQAKEKLKQTGSKKQPAEKQTFAPLFSADERKAVLEAKSKTSKTKTVQRQRKLSATSEVIKDPGSDSIHNLSTISLSSISSTLSGGGVSSRDGSHLKQLSISSYGSRGSVVGSGYANSYRRIERRAQLPKILREHAPVFKRLSTIRHRLLLDESIQQLIRFAQNVDVLRKRREDRESEIRIMRLLQALLSLSNTVRYAQKRTVSWSVNQFKEALIQARADTEVHKIRKKKTQKDKLDEYINDIVRSIPKLNQQTKKLSTKYIKIHRAGARFIVTVLEKLFRNRFVGFRSACVSTFTDIIQHQKQQLAECKAKEDLLVVYMKKMDSSLTHATADLINTKISRAVHRKRMTMLVRGFTIWTSATKEYYRYRTLRNQTDRTVDAKYHEERRLREVELKTKHAQEAKLKNSVVKTSSFVQILKSLLKRRLTVKKQKGRLFRIWFKDRETLKARHLALRNALHSFLKQRQFIVNVKLIQTARKFAFYCWKDGFRLLMRRDTHLLEDRSNLMSFNLQKVSYKLLRNVFHTFATKSLYIKKSAASTVSDGQTVSPTVPVVKLCYALQSVLTSVLHKNQNRFIQRLKLLILQSTYASRFEQMNSIGEKMKQDFNILLDDLTVMKRFVATCRLVYSTRQAFIRLNSRSFFALKNILLPLPETETVTVGSGYKRELNGHRDMISDRGKNNVTSSFYSGIDLGWDSGPSVVDRSSAENNGNRTALKQKQKQKEEEEEAEEAEKETYKDTQTQLHTQTQLQTQTQQFRLSDRIREKIQQSENDQTQTQTQTRQQESKSVANASVSKATHTTSTAAATATATLNIRKTFAPPPSVSIDSETDLPAIGVRTSSSSSSLSAIAMAKIRAAAAVKDEGSERAQRRANRKTAHLSMYEETLQKALEPLDNEATMKALSVQENDSTEKHIIIDSIEDDAEEELDHDEIEQVETAPSVSTAPVPKKTLEEKILTQLQQKEENQHKSSLAATATSDVIYSQKDTIKSTPLLKTKPVLSRFDSVDRYRMKQNLAMAKAKGIEVDPETEYVDESVLFDAAEDEDISDAGEESPTFPATKRVRKLVKSIYDSLERREMDVLARALSSLKQNNTPTASPYTSVDPNATAATSTETSKPAIPATPSLPLLKFDQFLPAEDIHETGSDGGVNMHKKKNDENVNKASSTSEGEKKKKKKRVRFNDSPQIKYIYFDAEEDGELDDTSPFNSNQQFSKPLGTVSYADNLKILF